MLVASGVYLCMKTERSGLQRMGPLLHFGWLTLLVSMWLVLHRVAEVSAAEEPRGVAVLLMRNCTQQEELQQGDGRPIWVRLKDSGAVYVNQEQIKQDSLLPLMSRVFETRQEKALYLLGDDGIRYDWVAKTAAHMRYAIPDLTIFLPTSSNMNGSMYSCLIPADPHWWAPR